MRRGAPNLVNKLEKMGRRIHHVSRLIRMTIAEHEKISFEHFGAAVA